MAFKTCFKAKNNADFTFISCWKVRLCQHYLVSDSGEDHSMGHQGVRVYQALRFRQILHRNPKHELVIEPDWTNGTGVWWVTPLGGWGMCFRHPYSHVHVIDAQFAVEVFLDVTAEPHSLRGKEETFSAHEQTGNTALLFWPAYLALLDGLGGNGFEKLDGLVVVQGAAGPDHVAEELDGVQLPVRIVGSGVIHKADLVKEKNFWNGMK